MPIRPADCLNINNCTISGVISGTPSYTPHAETPALDAMHFMMYQFIGGTGKNGRQFVVNHIVCQCYGRIARFVNEYCERGDEIVGIGFMKTNNPDKGQYRTEFHIRQLQKPRRDGIPGSDWYLRNEAVIDDMPDGTVIF